MLSVKDVLDVQIITIVISALIVSVIRIFAKIVKEGTMEVVDNDYREEYRRTKEYTGKFIILGLLTLAIIYVIYVYHTREE